MISDEIDQKTLPTCYDIQKPGFKKLARTTYSHEPTASFANETCHVILVIHCFASRLAATDLAATFIAYTYIKEDISRGTNYETTAHK